ncbi:CUB domain-containing protein 2 [Penaeus vannamei]|uniref:CUB domain-containing protein 2 n=1 Tax=Penaeus vannamei TaxID=6689 RepID=UPI00387F5CFC
MAVFGAPLLLVILALWGGQVSARQNMSRDECIADGGACVSPGNCMTPNRAAETCNGGSVCCNPTGLEAFKQTLELDGFEVDLRGWDPCSDKKCLGWYRGYWTPNPADCINKWRLVMHCVNATTDLWCCAPPCRRKQICKELWGYCVPRKSHCPSGNTSHWMCGGKMCFCCLPPFPAPPCPWPAPSISICDHAIYNLAGEGDAVHVHSPDYNHPYENNLDCSLQVIAPSSCQIEVYLCEVSLEKCFYDTLTINNIVYCGNVFPQFLVTAGNTASMQFLTDFSQVNRGFNVALRAVNCFNCTEGPVYEMGFNDTNIVTNTGGRLVSPGFPNDYPNNVNFVTTITAPPGSIITFLYLLFDLEPVPPACDFDYLQIFDTTPTPIPTPPKYCGNVAPSFTMSATNEVEVVFFTDKAVVGKGFDICFTVVPAP